MERIAAQHCVSCNNIVLGASHRRSIMRLQIKHTTSTAHCITGHKGKCQYLHGHNYNFVIEIVSPKLDSLGMVVDFTHIKELVKNTLDNMFDHKAVIYEKDPYVEVYKQLPHCQIVNYNPTAENMASKVFKAINDGLSSIICENKDKLQVFSVSVEETENNIAKELLI